MEDKFIEYAPIIIVVAMFFFRSKLFATPQELVSMKEQILQTVKEEYATKEFAKFIREDIAEMKKEVKLISDYILTHQVQQ